MAGQSGLSRVIQATAVLIFLFGMWRLYQYFYGLTQFTDLILYTVLLLTIIGVGVLIFDEVSKPGDDFVGWAFLFGVGILAIFFGMIFVFYPSLTLDDPLTIVPRRVLYFIIFGIIILAESLLVRRKMVSGEHGVNSDTVGPIILKFIAIFTMAWGIYNLAWVLVANLKFFVTLFSQWQLLLLALGNIFVGLTLVIYVENQKRKPHFRKRRLPLFTSFLLLLTNFPIIGIYLDIPDTQLLPISLGLNLALIIISFYLVYHPIKSR